MVSCYIIRGQSIISTLAVETNLLAMLLVFPLLNLNYRLRNIEKAISYRTKNDKIKVAKTLHTMIIPDRFEDVIQETNTNTLISLLSCGDADCTDEDPEEAERRRQEEEQDRKRQEAEKRERQQAKEKEEEEARQKEQNNDSHNSSDTEKSEEQEEKNKSGFMQSLKNRFIKITKIFTETEE